MSGPQGWYQGTKKESDKQKIHSLVSRNELSKYQIICLELNLLCFNKRQTIKETYTLEL